LLCSHTTAETFTRRTTVVTGGTVSREEAATGRHTTSETERKKETIIGTEREELARKSETGRRRKIGLGIGTRKEKGKESEKENYLMVIATATDM
jgi:hypothetical protein